MHVLLLLLMNAISCSGEIFSAGVGMIGRQTLTSREVQIQHLLEVALTNPLIKSDLKVLELESRAFAQAAQGALLEGVVALEAQSFNLMQLTVEELAREKHRVLTILGAAPAWVGLHVAASEIDEGLRRKLRARRYTTFRAETFNQPVTDLEVQRAQGDQSAKPAHLPLEKAREQIRLSVARAQREKRLREWYDGLLAKYAAKNLLTEF